MEVTVRRASRVERLGTISCTQYLLYTSLIPAVAGCLVKKVALLGAQPCSRHSQRALYNEVFKAYDRVEEVVHTPVTPCDLVRS